jgi:hypothetical protein
MNLTKYVIEGSDNIFRFAKHFVLIACVEFPWRSGLVEKSNRLRPIYLTRICYPRHKHTHTHTHTTVPSNSPHYRLQFLYTTDFHPTTCCITYPNVTTHTTSHKSLKRQSYAGGNNGVVLPFNFLHVG